MKGKSVGRQYKTLVIGSLILFGLLAKYFSSSHFDYFAFDRQRWLTAGQKRQFGEDNPRQNMVSEVMAHHLPSGLTRAQVVALLGPAEQEGIVPWAPAGVYLPDSLVNAPSWKQHKWTVRHTHPTAIMRYEVGWAFFGPTSLYLEFDVNGRLQRSSVRSSDN